MEINDAVYLVRKGVEGTRGVQILFIHGLQIEEDKDPFLETWLSEDGGDLWPRSWLSESFPTAHIYFVRYDSCMRKGDRSGRLDMFLIAENLLQSLLHAKIGQNSSNPVIMIGQDVGGLVIKEICLQAFSGASVTKEPMAREKRLFLDQLKGVFYFSTPHRGFHHWDQDCQGELMEHLKVHNKATSRSNEYFRKMRSMYKWSSYGLGAALPGKEKVMDVKEGSGRYDVDDFIMISTATTVDICRPKDRQSLSFVCLENFIQKTLSGFANRDRVKLPFSSERKYVPLNQTESEIREKLKDPKTRVVVLYGDAGTGKSCLVKYLALQYEQEAETGCNSEFRGGILYFSCGCSSTAIPGGMIALKVWRQILRELQVDETVISTYDEDHSLMANYARKLVQDLNVLIILDDVSVEYRKEFVEKVVFPEAKEVKYLMTSQSGGWSGYSTCQIDAINDSRAKQIIAKHAGLRDDILPEDCEDVVDEIIQATNRHPLALATVSTSVRADAGDRVLCRADWEYVRDNLLVYLKGDRPERPSAFGEVYPRTVFEAMMCAVDGLLGSPSTERHLGNDNESLHLMSIMALFESPFPTSVVHLFMLCTWHELSRQVPMLIMRLRNCQLVQQVVQPRNVYTVPYVTTTELPFLMMHSLLQQFILSCVNSESYPSSIRSVKVIRSTLAPFLSETNDGGALDLEHPCREFRPKALSTALCALYGVAQSKKAALGKLGKYQAELKIPVWNVHFQSSKQWSRHYCLEVLMAGIEEHSTSTEIPSALQKVVWKYIFALQIDDHGVSNLISGGYVCALSFLMNHAVGLRFSERFELTSSILRSSAAAVGLLKRVKCVDKVFNSRILTVLGLFQCLASTLWGSDASIIVDAFDLKLEYLLQLLVTEAKELPILTLLIQVLGTLAESDSKIELQLISLLRPKLFLQEAIKSVIEKIVADLSKNGKSVLRELSGHGSDDYSESGMLYKVMLQLNTVVKAVNILRHFQTFGEEEVVATVESISTFLEDVARLFRGNLAEYLCVMGLATFRFIPCDKVQGGRSVLGSIPGAIEGVVSVVRKIYQQPENRVMHYALDVLDYWTCSDDSIRSGLLSEHSFLSLLIDVVADHKEELHPLRQLSAVSILETFVTNDEEAASTLISVVGSHRVEHVLSYLLEKDPQRVLQRSALKSTISDGIVASSYKSGRNPSVLPDLQATNPMRVSQRFQLTVRDGSAQSTSIECSGPTVHQVMSVLARNPSRDLQMSVVTVFLYLGYSIHVESCTGLLCLSTQHPQGRTDDHAMKITDAFKSLLEVIFNTEQKVAQVTVLKLLVYLVRNHSSARARICDIPSALSGLATLLHEDEPAVQELARQASIDLTASPCRRVSNLSSIAYPPGAVAVTLSPLITNSP